MSFLIVKIKRLTFFNSADGVQLRKKVLDHEVRQGKELYCVLCGWNNSTKRGNRSSYHCNLCGTSLCLRIHPGLRRSGWTLWRFHKEVKFRVNTENKAVTRRNNESSLIGSNSRISLQ